MKQWEIKAFPTLVLIDPDGKFQGVADLDKLKKVLAEEKEIKTKESDSKLENK